MGSFLTTVVLLVLLILISAFFSATETAFSSINIIRLKNLANNGDTKAKSVLDLSQDYDKLLTTILIGNNIVNIGAASLATVIFINFLGDAGITVSTIVMTILVLIFGEISPKILAKESPENFAMFSVNILKMLTILFSPFTSLFALWKKLLYKYFKKGSESAITEQELITIVEEAEHGGGIDADESELIRSAIEFNDLEASDVLTPRVDIVAVSGDENNGRIREIFLETGYTRLPVYKETIDNIVGVINQKDFHNYVSVADSSIDGIIKPAIFATSSMKISRLLKLLQKSKAHIAVIIDEYGGTMGIVTLEDIIEELVGEIWDEHDEIINEFERVGEHQYKFSCSANLDKMFELFNIRREIDITTISGWVMHELGCIPNVGDSFTFENLHISVTKVDYKRVIEILVTVNSTCEENAE